MQILGVANSYASEPVNAPTSLSAIPTDTSVAISFTAPTNDGGAAITNYEYSFNNSSWTALSPADATSPVTVSGLAQNTAYSVYLRAVNIVGSGPASTAVSFTTFGPPTGTTTISSVSSITATTATVNFSTTAGGSAITGYDYYLTSWVDAGVSSSPKNLTGLTSGTSYTVYVRPKNAYGVGSQSAGVGFTTVFNVEYLVVAGGGGAGNGHASGGGGAGGYLTSASFAIPTSGFTITVGAGGAAQSQGSSSVLSSVSSTGGGFGGSEIGNGGSGGSGGGGEGYQGMVGGAGTAGQGNAGGNGTGGGNGGYGSGGGGGGAGGSGANAVSTNQGGNGGSGISSSITGSAVTRAGGGGAGGFTSGGSGGAGGGGNGVGANAGNPGSANTGGGGGGSGGSGGAARIGGAGGSGIVIIAYPSTFPQINTIGAGLTYSVSTVSRAGYRVYTFTAGTGTVSF